MPVGTKGTVKGLSSQQLVGSEDPADDLAPEIILGNTYHLALQPGTPLLADLGGLHSFMAWPRNLLTDSGGFQMVSLLKLAEITEQGVTFKSPLDGSEMLLTPEQSIQCQNEIGADIMMQLDDVVSSVSPGTTPRGGASCPRFHAHHPPPPPSHTHTRRPCNPSPLPSPPPLLRRSALRRGHGPQRPLARPLHRGTQTAPGPGKMM